MCDDQVYPIGICGRHLKTCDHIGDGRRYRRCRCPIWVDGFLGYVERLRPPTLKKFRVMLAQLTAFGEHEGRPFLSQFDLPALKAISRVVGGRRNQRPEEIGTAARVLPICQRERLGTGELPEETQEPEGEQSADVAIHERPDGRDSRGLSEIQRRRSAVASLHSLIALQRNAHRRHSDVRP
jgi:hypothetical protein